MIEFNDTIENNAEVIAELLRGVPPAQRNKAKRAAVAIENIITRLQKGPSRQTLRRIGRSVRIFKLAERIVKAPKQGDSEEARVDSALIMNNSVKPCLP